MITDAATPAPPAPTRPDIASKAEVRSSSTDYATALLRQEREKLGIRWNEVEAV